MVFVIFADFYLGETIRWNYAMSFICIFLAVLWTALIKMCHYPPSATGLRVGLTAYPLK